MPQSFNKIIIHAIWATKDWQPLITKTTKQKIHRYIWEQFEDSGCLVIAINGMADHIHCLFLLNPLKSVASITDLIKQNTENFINEQQLIAEVFEWQEEYVAFSVSESLRGKVFEYIKNQKLHHRTRTLAEEYGEFGKMYGF